MYCQITTVEIKENQFFINGKPTYEGRVYKGMKIEGLLMNSRMVQGIFDDLNPESRNIFAYPDTKTWDADRNTDEFVKSMEVWKSYGLISFTLNLQGGSPTGYGNKNWLNPFFDKKGNILPGYLNRLEKILNRADQLGMVVILGYFYFGQDQNLENEDAVLYAADNISEWILEKGYKNILVEINNECDIKSYDHDILKTNRVHELITRVKNKEKNGRHLWVSVSYSGGTIPDSSTVKISDFILLHGNSVTNPDRISEMVRQTRKIKGYINQPILFNEDDHYDYDEDSNNFMEALKEYASWGFFDFRRDGESLEEGYQSVPVNWGLSSRRKKDFFDFVRKITGIK